MFHERTKHIDVKYHYVRDVISQGKLKVYKISTHDNPLKLSWFDSLAQEAMWRQNLCSLLCSGDNLIYAIGRNLSQGGVCYIVIQILYKKKTNFRRSGAKARRREAPLRGTVHILLIRVCSTVHYSSCKLPLGVVYKHPI